VPFRILILGAYGTFGTRICRSLVSESTIQLAIAGRDRERATAFAASLGATCEPVVIDYQAPDFAATLSSLRSNLVIHTAGAFQAQDYRVASAAIDAGAHYIDLADARAFVAGIGALDERARARGVVVTSGASTLPAVSSAAVERLVAAFSELHRIEINIAPAQVIARGLATMESVLSYCGKPFLELIDGEWRTVRGWLGLRRVRYPALGTRWAARCDVPDLPLLPKRYPTVRSARFDAALELTAAQFGMAGLAGLTRIGVLSKPERFAALVLRLARLLDRFGSDVGGMQVVVEGVTTTGQRLRRAWYLVAKQGDGPQIPCIPAIVIARKLARGERIELGARPCMGMMTLEEFDAATDGFDIRWEIKEEELP
jgi:saccharopine dehydrogenase-like NADP-dependent oxidoreductase